MGQPRSGEAASPSAANEAAKPAGTGMRSLLRGQPPAAAPGRGRIPRWYLFGADLLLVALALIVMYKSPVPLTGMERLFGVAAVALGAFLALIAACMKNGKDL